MAKTRPGRIYKQIKSQSYTRREYMGGVPGSRIIQFDAGDKSQNFPVVAHLVAEERVAILHNCLESARIAANRVMTKGCGAMGYHMRVRAYPHEVVRENKQASGAGADRVSQGMRRSFGKAVATAARVERNQAIITFSCRPEQYPVVREAARKANMKLPTPTRLVLEKGEDLVQSVLATGVKFKAAASKTVKEPAAEGAAPAEGAAAAPAKADAKPAAAGGDKKEAPKKK